MIKNEILEKDIEYLSYYLKESPADSSLDKNANNGGKSYVHFVTQLNNSRIKQLGKETHKRKMKELFGENDSEEFWKLVDEKILYFHDATKMFVPYCFGVSTSFLVQNGNPYNHLKSYPPKRTDTYISQVIELIMSLSQEFAGAIAVADIFIEYAKFSIKENKSDKEIENDFQKFVHTWNNPLRISGDAPFTNVSIFDRKMIKGMFKFDDWLYYNKDFTEENLIDEIIRVQKIFINFMYKKDPISNIPYRFPIVTINFLINENGEYENQDFLNWFSEFGKEGLFNIYLTKDIGKIASCCRLVNDIKIMTEHLKLDSFGNGGINIGSARCITINLLKGKKYRLEYLAELVTKGLKTHRELIKDLINSNFLKYFSPVKLLNGEIVTWLNLDRMFFSTVGYIGLYESCNQNIDSMKKEIKYLRDLTFEMSEKYNIPINLEQVPAESAASKLAEGTEYKILSNQYLPLWEDYDIQERLKVAGKFDNLITGGAITHINLGDKPTEEQFKQIMISAAKYGVNHFAINLLYAKCKNGHVNYGKFKNCPVCGVEDMDYITRVVGYLTSTKNWDKVRREYEFGLRKWF